MGVGLKGRPIIPQPPTPTPSAPTMPQPGALYAAPVPGPCTIGLAGQGAEELEGWRAGGAGEVHTTQ